MNFLNPAVLIGLVAAAIPLILHLINLRKLKKIEFSTLKFIKELQKTKIKKLKIKQWLLLIIRTLIIIFVVLAFSRPVTDSNIPYFSSYSKTSTVLLIDNSFSMDISDEYGNRLKQAKRIAKEITNLIKDGDEIAVIPMADIELNTFSLSRNYNLINEQIDAINISNYTANPERSLITSFSILDDAVNLNKEIFIISDMADNLFDSLNDSLAVNTSDSGINIIQIGKDSQVDIKNYSLDSLTINNQIFQFGSEILLDALLTNHSDNEIENLVVSLNFNERRVAQRSVDLPPDNSSGISIETEINARGAIDASLELESDELLQDNYRYFSFLIPEKPSVAVYSENNYKYINLVLNASNSEIITERFDRSNIGTANFNKYDLIILAEPPNNNSDLLRLQKYAEGGGSIIAFASNEMTEEYKNFLNVTGFGTVEPIEFADNSNAQIDYTDVKHPVFNDLFINSDEGKQPESPDVYNLQTNSGGKILMRIAEHALLSESVYNSGKLFYFALSPDIKMSDFPLTALFPALIYKSIMYLTAKDIKGNDFIIGEQISITIEPKYSGDGNFEIIDPNGNSFFAQGIRVSSGSLLSFKDLSIPGNYMIKNNDRIVSIFSVNVNPSESDNNYLNEEEINQKLEQIFTDALSINHLSSTEKIDNMIIRARIGSELWQIFVILALVFSALEMIIQKTLKTELNE
jgi:hypothetical protein